MLVGHASRMARKTVTQRAPRHEISLGRSRAVLLAANPARVAAITEPIPYGFFGMAPGPNKSERSVAFAASFRNGSSNPKICCMVRRSEECVKLTGLA